MHTRTRWENTAYRFGGRGLLLGRCVGIEVVGGRTRLLGFLHQHLLDCLWADVGLRILGGFLCDRNCALLAQFGFGAIGVFRRHGAAEDLLHGGGVVLQ